MENFDILDYVHDEDKAKVVFSKKIIYNDNFEKEVNKFIFYAKEIILSNESIVIRNEEFSFDIQITKNDVYEFKNDAIWEDAKEDEEIIFNLTIFKESPEDGIHIFSIDKFSSNINSKNIENRLKYFQDLYNENKYYFISRITKIYISTETFCFLEFKSYKNNKPFLSVNSVNRNEVLNSFKKNCNYSSSLNLKIIPNDLFILDDKYKDTKISEIMNKLCVIISMIYLSNITEFKCNKYLFKIFGYKNSIVEVDQTTKIKSEDIFDLYKWCYSNPSNISDKIGIFRNVMSLLLINRKIEDLDKNLLKSCKSNYEIYLMENIERYIEVKNYQHSILNGIIDDFVNSINTYVENFKQALKNILTFIFSVLLLNTISTGKLNNIFTNEISLISIGILFTFIIIAKISKKEAKKSLEILENKYQRNKKNSLDIIDENDLNRILDNDNYFNDAKKQALDRIDSINNHWILSIIIYIIIIIFCNKFELFYKLFGINNFVESIFMLMGVFFMFKVVYEIFITFISKI